ncbi:NAD(P)/FAD-dependent oxidoreductase [Paenarthrobacter sp. NPDC058040]|uniref:NAD(P)/FAD-dependent oxidoreductase n=1 Tax=unclassified Paenarthrobacter TaxID=2634190 RepID=UPI0036DA7388
MSDSVVLDTADIVVVGAGISGLSTAFELRKRGFDVVVAEQRFPAYGASGRNSGSIWLQTRRTGLELDLARAGRDKYKAYVEELSNTFEFRQHGGLFFYETDEQAAVMAEYAKDRRSAGLEVDVLSLKQARELTTVLPETAIGAVFCADDAQVDAHLFVGALASACVRMGVRKYENTSVLSTIRRGNAITGVRTVRGEIHAPGLVWATGAWSVNLAAEGIELPVITARQGQMVTQSVPVAENPLLHGPRGVAHCSALTSLDAYKAIDFPSPDRRPHTATQNGQGSDNALFDDSIAQNREGRVFMGSSLDSFGSLNPHIGIASTYAMISTALDRYGENADLGVTGLWAGLASSTPDHLPIIDRLDRAYVNTGHTWGVASGPIGGQITAELIAGERSTFAYDLRLSRPSLAVKNA